MDWKLLLTNSILLGVGLAIDAFSVSVADTMAEPHMARSKKLLIASVFAIFQTLMPLMGWFFVKAAAERFLVFQKAIPYIALLLLLYLGFKMIMESRKSEEDNEKKVHLTLPVILIQGVATSIDALSVGFAISSYSTLQAIASTAIIGIVTLIICALGLEAGKKVGSAFSSRATLIGGIILMAIGVEIFVEGVFF